ncbi:MAG TPA: DUF2127 domain-containing protein [Acidimicrobiales bacterium]|nr:DUF2127 domain-containing protein [Acidimicrobiales bacterium]
MRARPVNRYELLTCAWRGHVLVGADADLVTADDRDLVREAGGLRFHHCLRCYDWVALPPPPAPARERVESREELRLPLRGRLLRDRYILRLIALDRAVHVVVLVGLAVVLLVVAGDHDALQRDYTALVDALGGPSQTHPFFADVKHLLRYSPTRLRQAAAVVLAYAALEATEMVGLWLTKRWAEYLTFVATCVFIPFEVYELTESVSVLKVVTFVINVAIAAYLLWSKRLFGLHGGQRAEQARRRAEVSFEALEASIPTAAEPTTRDRR